MITRVGLCGCSGPKMKASDGCRRDASGLAELVAVAGCERKEARRCGKCVAKVCKLAVLLRQMKEEREGQVGTKARRWSENGSLVEALPKEVEMRATARLALAPRQRPPSPRLVSNAKSTRAPQPPLCRCLAPRRRPLPKSGDRNQHQPAQILPSTVTRLITSSAQWCMQMQ